MKVIDLNKYSKDKVESATELFLRNILGDCGYNMIVSSPDLLHDTISTFLMSVSVLLIKRMSYFLTKESYKSYVRDCRRAFYMKIKELEEVKE